MAQQYFDRPRTCGQCGTHFTNIRDFMAHRDYCFPDLLPSHYHESVDTGVGIHRFMHQHALNRRTYAIRFTPEDDGATMQPDTFFNLAMPHLMELHSQLLNDCHECKVHFVIQVRIVQLNADGEVSARDRITISIPAVALQEVSMVDIISRIQAKLEAFIRKGSNWIIEGVDWFDFCITRFYSVPLHRGHGFVQLPKRLKHKKAVVNVDNRGRNDCFKYAVLSVLYYDCIASSQRNRTSVYEKFMDKVNWSGLSFPMTAAQVPVFEKHNPTLRINMLKWDEDETTHPVRNLYHSKKPVEKAQQIISVLVVDMTQDKDGPAHFVGVTNLNRLLNKQGNGNFHCERCLQPFTRSDLLEKHRPTCYGGYQETLIPAEKTVHKFENWRSTQKLPYVIYADIECVLEKGNSGGEILETHKPISFAFLLVSNKEMVNRPLPLTYQVFTGVNCIEEGLKAIESTARDVYEWVRLNSDVPVKMSPRDKAHHAEATTCYMCQRDFIKSDPLRQKVIEHDHLSGKYRGAACQECNNNIRLNRTYLPIVFHNLKHYDGHIICLQGLGNMKHWTIGVVPQTAEKYMMMSARFIIRKYWDRRKNEEKNVYMTLRFLDSYQFLTASLDALVRNLEMDQLYYCRTLHLPSEELIKSKGVFPYSFLDSPDKLDYPQLPSREAFTSSLTKDPITEEDYERAQRAWQLFRCETMKDYMEAYLKLDVYQLADIFENFRSLSLREDGLDPLYYITLPGLSWDSAFKKTGVQVDLISDAEMYAFFERGIRGGMTFMNEHHLEANSPRVAETYDPSKGLRDLLYVDANNLYGHALSMKLPQSQFQWLTESERNTLDLLSFDEEGDWGYILEVDLTYPPDVQDRTLDLPFAPEKLDVQEELFTESMKAQWKLMCETRYGTSQTKKYPSTEKLLLTHFDREHYIVHGALLKFYLQQGLILTKVHRGVKFFQSAFFEPYITYNSRRRQEAKNSFEKDYYKLKNNALFGKTMENVRKRMEFRLCNNEEKMTTLASRPEFLSTRIFSKDLVGIHLAKNRVVLNKPIYIGMSVLELSKLEMYQLRYIHLTKYERDLNGTIRIAGGDTDSFFLRIDGIDVAHKLLPRMLKDDLLDTSNYPHDHPLFSNRNKARLGCIKDEAEGKAFLEWILLRPKMYSMQVSGGGGKDKKRAKGVRRSTLAKEIRHQDYRRTIQDHRELTHSQRRIGSKAHVNYSLEYKKRSLTFFDDKRAWIDDNRSLPYGNHALAGERRLPPRKRLPEIAPQNQPSVKKLCT